MNPSDHDTLVRRDSFNRHASTYAKGRPPYPPRVYAFMEEIGALSDHCRILEIGPGTGQATADLLRRGAVLDAVELGADLAAGLRSAIADADPNLHVRVGDIHTIDLPDATYDTVVSATAFHWLQTDVLLPRLARTLKPDGWLVVWWTVFGDPLATTPFRNQVDRIFRERLPSAHVPLDTLPRPMQTADRSRELTHGDWFGNVRHEEIRWNYRQDAQQARDLFATFPVIAALEVEERTAFLDEIAAAVDDEGGLIEDPFVTVVYAAQVRPEQHTAR